METTSTKLPELTQGQAFVLFIPPCERSGERDHIMLNNDERTRKDMSELPTTKSLQCSDTSNHQLKS